MPTWHPAALLRDETKKIEFLNDLRAIWGRRFSSTATWKHATWGRRFSSTVTW